MPAILINDSDYNLNGKFSSHVYIRYNHLNVTSMRQELVDQGSVHEVGAESLVPDDRVEQTWADKHDDPIDNYAGHFEAVPLEQACVGELRRIHFCHFFS